MCIPIPREAALAETAAAVTRLRVSAWSLLSRPCLTTGVWQPGLVWCRPMTTVERDRFRELQRRSLVANGVGVLASGAEPSQGRSNFRVSLTARRGGTAQVRTGMDWVVGEVEEGQSMSLRFHPVSGRRVVPNDVGRVP